MARPRQWERGEGRVLDLTPVASNLIDLQAGQISNDEYRSRFTTLLEPFALVPGQLKAYTSYGIGLVENGDTLCCACSRADAAAGQCHRAWAAPFLARAGWRVILDGVEVIDDSHPV
jgi:hypothetical protein